MAGHAPNHAMDSKASDQYTILSQLETGDKITSFTNGGVQHWFDNYLRSNLRERASTHDHMVNTQARMLQNNTLQQQRRVARNDSTLPISKMQ
ncbi:hypothetical protein FI667_g12482, partial [Globisporangium splendens]